MNELESTISQIIEENYIPNEWNEVIVKELDALSLETNLKRILNRKKFKKQNLKLTKH